MQQQQQSPSTPPPQSQVRTTPHRTEVLPGQRPRNAAGNHQETTTRPSANVPRNQPRASFTRTTSSQQGIAAAPRTPAEELGRGSAPGCSGALSDRLSPTIPLSHDHQTPRSPHASHSVPSRTTAAWTHFSTLPSSSSSWELSVGREGRTAAL